MEMGEAQESRFVSRTTAWTLFWGVLALEGVFSLIGVLLLPPSEERNARWFGFSPYRLLVWTIQGLGIGGCAVLFFRSLLTPQWAQQAERWLREGLARHSLIAAAGLSLLAAWSLGILLLEFLLNPSIFPRAVLYQFWFIRVRPLLLWSLAGSIQGVCLFVWNGWYDFPRFAWQRMRPRWRWGYGAVILAFCLNVLLWLYFVLALEAFQQGDALLNGVILLGFGLLLVGLWLATPRESAAPGEPALALNPLERKPRWLEPLVYGLMGAGLLALYGISSFGVPALPDPNDLNYARLEQVAFGFGFKQLRLVPLPFLWGWAGLTLAAMIFAALRPAWLDRWGSHINRAFYARRVWTVAAGLAFFAACVLLSSRMISADMKIYMQWLPDQFRLGWVHVRFDEMWESNLHYNLFILLNTFLGWDVPSSFRTLSCAAAPFFIVLLLSFCRRLLPEKALLLFGVLVSGGYMQLFFGDMEYYTISLTLVLVYFYTACLYVRGETTFPVPALVLALAMTFHLETAYLLPTLFFLSILAVERHNWLHLVTGWLGLVCFFSLTLLFFGHNHVSLVNMRDTSWGLGRAGNMLANFMPFEAKTFLARLNMLALIFPLIGYLLPLLAFGRVRLEPFNGFLLVGALCGLPFSLTWISTIGFYSDWNLFSMPMFPAIFLLSYNLVGNVQMAGKRVLLVGMLSLSFLVSYAWIVSNHF